MLRDFIDLKEGDWVLQNGANSSVNPFLLLCLYLMFS